MGKIYTVAQAKATKKYYVKHKRKLNAVRAKRIGYLCKLGLQAERVGMILAKGN